MCAKWLVPLLVGGLALGAAMQSGQAAEDSPYQMPLVVRADGLRISDNVAAMARGTEVFLPVRELALALEFPVDLDAGRGRAEGWFLDPSRRYRIDSRSGQVFREGASRTFAPEAFLTELLDERRELYVKAAVIEHAWPVDLNLSHADLALEVEPLEPLPVQKRRAREKRRERLRGRHGPEQPDLPVQPHPYGWLSPPVVGLDLHARSGGGPRATRQRLFWSQEVAGLNVAGGLFASGPSFSDSEVRDARLTVQRFAGNESLVGGIERIAAGDVSGESLARVGSVGNGRGISVSSFPLTRGTAYDQHQIEGDAPPGWEAELYQDGRLMDFQQVGVDGRYRFDGIDLGYGLNRLRVVLYGPQGQTRERTEIVDVGQTQARPGATHVRFDHVEAGRDFVPVGDGVQPNGEPGMSVRAVHGVSRGLSVEAGFIDLPSRSARPGARYALLGAAGALGSTATRVRLLSEEQGGSALDVESRLRAGSIPLRFGFGVFDEFESPRVGYGATALRGDFDVGVQAPLTLFGERLRLGARYSFSETVAGTQRHDVDFSQRWNVGGIAWHHEVDYRVSGAGAGRWSAHLDASDRWMLGPGRNLLWGAGLAYAQDVGVTDARLRTRYRWSRATTFGANVRHAAATGRTAGTLDITRQWGNARLSLTASGGGTDGRVGLRYGIGFGPRGGGGYALAGTQAPRQGAVAVHAFVDEDGDGAYDPGEPPVPRARLEQPLGGDAVTGEDGRMVRHDLEAHRNYAVRLDPESLEHPFWLPADEGRELRVRPGSVPVVELPVQETGAVSGTVRLSETDTGTSGVPLRLVDASGRTVSRTRSIFDGFFSFESVPYGEYQVRLDDARGYALTTQLHGVALSSAEPMVSGVTLGVEHRSTLTAHEGEQDRTRAEQSAGTVQGVVYLDTGEQRRPIAGVRVRLLTRGGEVVAQTESKGGGRYRLADIGVGEYRVHVPAAPESEGSLRTITIDRVRQEIAEFDLLTTMTPDSIGSGSIEGVVVSEEGNPLGAVRIRLLDSRGQVVQLAHSADDGRYRFEGVPSGRYAVRVSAVDEFTRYVRIGAQRSHVRGADLIGIAPNAVSDGHVKGVIEGTVYAGGNNSKQPVDGVRIRLLDSRGAVAGQRRSAADGSYRFEGMPSGDYRVHLPGEVGRESTRGVTITAADPRVSGLELRTNFASGRVPSAR